MKLSDQKGLVIWMLGLSGAGKSTVSNLIEAQFQKEHIFSIQLDGDELRKGLNSNLGFSMDDRAENIRRAAETAKIIANKGIIVICSFITPLNEHRALAQQILQEMYFEVFVDCPLHICQERDVKGLYKMAQHNTLKNFTGISSAFEKPENPDLILLTANLTAEQCCDQLYTTVSAKINSIQLA
ncbi:adenylyl-sulfate kinase [Pedobacter nyackensis]|uniref:adenylyl-sulfate kinase n=1 Tax=Pedobacter nyackensis TaxID=475255 RepID=UPI0029301E1B|nr:adenylyl-sulfate kinase [Pedobacter nyackensis]